MPAFVPVVICGGSGARLWPHSRQALPKPFAPLPGQPRPLIDDTYARLAGAPLPAVAAVVTVAAAAYAPLCRQHYRAGGGAAPHLVVAEPAARNTAPAIAVALEWVRRRFGGDALVAVLPADHAIGDSAAYRASLAAALQVAQQGHLALLGIAPASPATGFGYIECGDALEAEGARAVRRFVEKPDAERAAQFVAAGNFLWNSGMFCFTAAAAQAQLAAHAAPVAEAAAAAFADFAGAADDGDDFSPPAAAYEKFPAISFDYAVMEKTADAAVVRAADFAWRDVGSWRAIADSLAADESGNRALGDALLHGCRDCFAAADGGRLVGAVGLSGVYIMDTPDAVLVADAARSEEVRALFETLSAQQRREALHPAAVRCPWGTYRVLAEGAGYKVKRIDVSPRQKLSLQSHRRRAEHWVCVSGQMGVVIEERDFALQVGESCHIPAQAKHRMYNDTDAPAAVVETQTGDYLGEDDIVRYSDIYGRA